MGVRSTARKCEIMPKVLEPLVQIKHVQRPSQGPERRVKKVKIYTLSYTYTQCQTNIITNSISYNRHRSTQNLFHDGDQATP
jgi:hypothetical protein